MAGDVRDWVVNDATLAAIDSIFARWDSTETPGAALGIYREGEIVLAKGYGMSNLEHGIPIVPSSIFHIASISKQFTDMCVALLAAEGALDVDDDIRLYVPEVPDFGHTITIRHLIHHVSGLRDQWSLLYLSGWRQEDLVTEDDVLDLVKRQTALNFTPNDEYLYCNTGYTLLAVIVKRVSGLSLRQFAQKRIFGPLGMTRTHFHDDHSEIVRGRTQAYEPRKGGGYHVSNPVFDVVGTTSLFTTVEDLARWDGNFISAQVGGPALIAQAQTPGTFNNGKAMTYAWGLTTGTYRGATRIGHSGADHGYRADYLRLPEFGLTVTVLSNVANSGPNALTERVADAVLGDLLAPNTGAAGASGATVRAGTTLVSPAAIAGTFHDAEHNTFLTITGRDGKAWLESYEPIELATVGNGRFTLDAGWGVDIALIASEIGEDGIASSLSVVMTGEDEAASYQRLSRVALDDAGLDAFAGTYWSDELVTSYEIVADHIARTLVVRRRKFEDQTLTPLTDDVFGRGSLQFGLVVTFQRDDSGKITGFRYTAGRIRNLEFTRR